MLKQGLTLLLFTLFVSTLAEFEVVYTNKAQAPLPGKEQGRIAVKGKDLYHYGGMVRCFNQTGLENEYDTEIFHLSLRTGDWDKYQAVGPAPRAFHGFAFLDDRLLLHSGLKPECPYDQPSAMYNDLWYFFPSNQSWVYKASGGPGVRVGAGYAVVGDRLYVWGGLNHNFAGLNDLWYWDISTEQWVLEHAGCSNITLCPYGRFKAHFLYSKTHDKFLLFNGDASPLEDPMMLGMMMGMNMSMPAFSDFWTYDLDARQWQRVLANGEGVSGRTQSIAWTKGNKAYIALGDVNQGDDRCNNDVTGYGDASVAEVWEINFKRALTPVNVTEDHLGSLDEFKGMAYTQDKNKVYALGGHKFKCNTPGQGFAVLNDDLYLHNA